MTVIRWNMESHHSTNILYPPLYWCSAFISPYVYGPLNPPLFPLLSLFSLLPPFSLLSPPTPYCSPRYRAKDMFNAVQREEGDDDEPDDDDDSQMIMGEFVEGYDEWVEGMEGS